MRQEEISYHTKKMLANALKEQMKKKSFQKITVSELVSITNMNRKTFYYHFENIYDLLKWMLEEEAIDVVKHFDLLVDYEEAITFVLNYLDQNNHIIKCAYDSIGRDELKRFFYTDFYDIIVSIIENAEKNTQKKLNTNYKEFLIDFYMEALTGILLDWIMYPDKFTRDQISSFTIRTIKDSLIGILEDWQSAF